MSILAEAKNCSRVSQNKTVKTLVTFHCKLRLTSVLHTCQKCSNIQTFENAMKSNEMKSMKKMKYICYSNSRYVSKTAVSKTVSCHTNKCLGMKAVRINDNLHHFAVEIKVSVTVLQAPQSCIINISVSMLMKFGFVDQIMTNKIIASST